MTDGSDFRCPQCASRYKLVRVRAEPGLPALLVHCKVCREPLAATDGDYALKYFLVDRVRKRNDIDLRMKHSRERTTAVQQQQQAQPETK
jgi:hypothetical protein